MLTEQTFALKAGSALNGLIQAMTAEPVTAYATAQAVPAQAIMQKATNAMKRIMEMAMETQTAMETGETMMSVKNTGFAVLGEAAC
jgi:hypothetical protein